MKSAANPAKTLETPPKPRTVLEILNAATVCPPLGSGEISQAMNTSRESAHLHLATMIVAHCAQEPEIIEAWHDHQLAETRRQAGAYSRWKKPDSTSSRIPAKTKPEGPAATYGMFLGQIIQFDARYLEQYQPPNGRPDRSRIGQLYDSTEGHVAVTAADAILESVQSEDRRTTAIAANRLVRFMVHESTIDPAQAGE